MVHIAIVNYEMGNLKSISSGLKKVGATVEITKERKSIIEADGICIPGVGAFGDAMKNLTDLKPQIIEQVAAGKPFLGVCLGFQLIFDESEEFGLHKGMGLLKGRVIRLPETVVTPHMGWNQIQIKQRDNPIMEGVPDRSYVYFVHSYYPVPENPNVIVATTDYGVDFPSVVGRDNIFATQFHPEKSSTVGLKMLTNFLKFIKS
jgi:glutamine amidotransferase